MITTNFDRVLRLASPSPGDLAVWDIEAAAGHSALLSGTLRRPTLWCLHGTLDDSANIILTPDGFGQLYGSDAAAALYTAAPAALRSLLLSHTFLFVGFSFDDEAIRSELEAMAETMKGTAGPHFAVVRRQDEAKIRGLNLPVYLLVIDDFGPPLLELLDEMVAIRDAAAPPAPPSPGAGFDPKNRAYHVPFRPKGDRVVGRAQALADVREQLEKGAPTSIGQTAAFRGLGGLGKTQLAVEYAADYGHTYPSGVIWLTADGDIASQLIEIAELAKWVSPESDHKSKLDIAMQRLRTFDGGLIVFDNVESRDHIEPYFPETSASPHMLLTSRFEIRGFKPIPLDTLGGDDAYHLLLQEADRTPEGTEVDYARQIAERLGGLPLALELAGAYLQNRPVSFEEYHRLLEASLTDALGGGLLDSFTRHDADLAATLAIHENVLTDSPAFRAILDVMTWSAATPMSVSLLQALLPDVSESDLRHALALGESLRLLQRVPDEPRYTLHRLVAEVRRKREPIEGEWAEATARRLADWFRERREDIAHLDEYEQDFDHLETWQHNLQARNANLAVELAWLQAYPPYHRGQVALAAERVERALKAFVPDKDWKELEGHLLHDYSTTLDALGQYNEALARAEESLVIRREALGEQHPDTASSLDSVSTSLDILGRYNEALARAEKALAIRRETLGERHPQTASSLASVSATLSALGRHDEALTRAEEALAIRRETLGERHPQTAISLNNVSVSLGNLARYPAAQRFAKDALDVLSETLGAAHPLTIEALDSLARMLLAQGYGTTAQQIVVRYMQGVDQNAPSYAKLRALKAEIESIKSRPGGKPSASRQKPGRRR